MAGTNLSFPYDAEVFNYSWKTTPDMVLTSMLESGALVNDPEIARLIDNGSNFFTTPYYDVLSGTEDVYNGVNNFTGGTLTGGNYSGVVYGRMASWSAKSFIKDFNSGADPMAQIVAGVANFWIKARQTRMIKLLDTIFGITGDADWALHTTSIVNAGVAQVEKAVCTTGSSSASNATVVVTALGMTGSPVSVTVALGASDDASTVAGKVRTALIANANVGHATTGFFTVTGTGADVILTAKVKKASDSTMNIAVTAGTTGTVFSASTDETVYVSLTDANKIGETSINDATVKANGDHATDYTLAIMHSVVANRLANLQLLNFSKYTDANGITRDLPIGTINGKTVIVNDSVTVANATILGEKEYATYVLGLGALRYAPAPVDVPSEMDRDPNTNGGLDMIYTRLRECIAPAGFSFIGDTTTDVGIPDSELFKVASWVRKAPAKSIKMVKLVTNG